MAVEVMAEEASGQCARACGALTRVRRACLRRARRACATPPPEGWAKAESSAHGQRDVIVCLTSSAASAFADAEQVRSCPLAASPVTYVLGHMRSHPVCARACMQKPTTWQRRDGVCLFVPTNMLPLVQIRTMHTKTKDQKHTRNILCAGSPCQHVRQRTNTPTKRAHAQWTLTRAASCSVQRMQRHQGVRSQHRGRPCRRRSGTGQYTDRDNTNAPDKKDKARAQCRAPRCYELRAACELAPA